MESNIEISDALVAIRVGLLRMQLNVHRDNDSVTLPAKNYDGLINSFQTTLDTFENYSTNVSKIVGKYDEQIQFEFKNLNFKLPGEPDASAE
jgi:hypothetical protein